MEHISFPSIPQFRDIVRHVRDSAKYHSVPLPVITFAGSVKVHGSNGAVVRPLNGAESDIYAQSRERVLSIEADNAGFYVFVQQHKTFFNRLCERAKALRPNATGCIQIYGEYFGSNIQKGVGVSQIKNKSFSVFGVRISENAESQDWFSMSEIQVLFDGMDEPNIYAKTQFTTFMQTVDFTRPELAQNKIAELTEVVEDDCPVARAILGPDATNLIGEGIVWEAISTTQEKISVGGMLFKSKGEKHSVSKVKTIASVDVEKVNSIREFVDMVATENRLNQGIDVLAQRGLSVEPKNTGEFIKWVLADILKEESDTMSASGLNTKDVTSGICSVARQFYMNRV